MTNEGWTFLTNTRKAHYFVDGRSLCGKWGYLGSGFDPPDESSPDDCTACTKRLEKRLETLEADDQPANNPS